MNNFLNIKDIDHLIKISIDLSYIKSLKKDLNWLINESIDLIDYNYEEEKDEFNLSKIDKCRASLLNLQTNLDYNDINLCFRILDSLKNLCDFNEEIKNNINIIEHNLKKLRAAIR